MPTFLGLDLAWSARNPSGVAAIDGDGRMLDVRADLRSDAEILTWLRPRLAPTTAIGIDMPTVVKNISGSRRCERELRAVFGRHDAGAYPANLNLTVFAAGGRAAHLLTALRADGVVETASLGARCSGRFAFEVFPHAALVGLFDLPKIVRYKKKSRGWHDVHAEWTRYRALLATLRDADPPLILDERIPAVMQARGAAYKAWEDALDAVTCAYIAAFVWRWGMDAACVRVFGSLDDGYIVVPDRRAAACN